MSLLADIEAYLLANRISGSKFGAIAVGDPKFVGELRRGRQVTPYVENRVRECLAGQQAPSKGKKLDHDKVRQLAKEGLRPVDIALRVGASSGAVINNILQGRVSKLYVDHKTTVEPRVSGPSPEPVYRDPCFRCGARGDAGCGHRP